MQIVHFYYIDTLEGSKKKEEKNIRREHPESAEYQKGEGCFNFAGVKLETIHPLSPTPRCPVLIFVWSFTAVL